MLTIDDVVDEEEPENQAQKMRNTRDEAAIPEDATVEHHLGEAIKDPQRIEGDGLDLPMTANNFRADLLAENDRTNAKLLFVSAHKMVSVYRVGILQESRVDRQ